MADTTQYISQITLPDNNQYLIKAASVPLSGVTGADDLKAIEALSGTSGLLKKTAANTWTLDTTNYTTNTGTVTSITPGNGLIKGTSGTSQAAITTTGTISIKEGGVTNAMLAGSIDNSKLSNSTITIGGNSVALGGSISLADLGLDSAMHYRGVVSAIPPTSGTYISGDVVVLSGTVKEYVYDGTNWRELGTEGSYKIKQTAYSDSTGTSESTTATRFVYSISQTADGAVSFKTRPLPTYNNYSHPTGDGNKHVPANGTGNDGKFLKATATAGTYEWANAVTSIIPGNGLINGTSGTSQTAITTSGTISIKEGGVTNSMLAGSIANNKLANSSITVGNKSISLGSSGTIDQIMLSSTSIGTNTSWDITNSGFYYVASSSNFTGEQNPGTNQEMPYTYGGLYVMHAGNGGAAQFYISHNASNTKSKANGIRYRSGWNVVNHTRENNTTPWISWATILDDKNYNLFVPTLTGIGASGTWGISITGNASGTASNVTGTVAIANGGTGKTTALDAANALLSGLPTWTADPTDNTVLIRRDTSGSESYGKVTFSTVWNYIKGKADSTYSASGHNHDGAYVARSAGVTNVAWDSNKITKTINGTTTDVVTIDTIKTALGTLPPSSHSHGNITNAGTIGTAGKKKIVIVGTDNKITTGAEIADSTTSKWLNENGTWTTPTKAEINLGNVTNHAQVTSLAYDSTNRKITYKISEGTAQDLVTFGTNAFTSYSNKITIGSKEITLGGSATLAEIGVSYPVTSVAGLTGAVTKAGLRSALDLSNVENTKLSTWAGTSNITTVGTITTGTWHGTAIEASYIGAHTHGNLTNDGKITSTATIANGDKLVIVDSDTTAASKIIGSSITFDGSSVNKALTPKGTWEIFSKTDTKVEIIHL